jgi:hypothetical protein
MVGRGLFDFRWWKLLDSNIKSRKFLWGGGEERTEVNFGEQFISICSYYWARFSDSHNCPAFRLLGCDVISRPKEDCCCRYLVHIISLTFHFFSDYFSYLKVEGLIPDGVIGVFYLLKFFRLHYDPVVDSASNRNEYQGSHLGVKAAGA